MRATATARSSKGARIRTLIKEKGRPVPHEGTAFKSGKGWVGVEVMPLFHIPAWIVIRRDDPKPAATDYVALFEF